MMHRRHFLRGLAGAAFAAAADPLRAAAPRERIVIVGGGIVGASLAYHLAKRGAQVTLLEKTAPAAGTTSKSFAWINADFSKQPQWYFELNRLGVNGYRRLQRDFGPELPVRWGGCVQWRSDEQPAADMRRRITQQQQWGYDVRAIDSEELAALEPRIKPGAMLAASYAPQEGFADPAATNHLLVRKAAAAGARVVYPCEVTGFDVHDAAIHSVKTSRDTFAADVVIVCGGTATPRIAAMAGIKVPLVPAPGLLLHTGPMPGLLHRVVNGPDVHLKQYRDGRMVIGDDLGPPPTDVHNSLRDEPADFPDPAFRELHRQRILKKAAVCLPQAAKATVERITIGYRPLPKDGYPIVGFTESCRNLYLAVTHSGVTLAPALGELASIEILERVLVQALDNCRLARFGA